MAYEPASHDAPEQGREELRERSSQSNREPDSGRLLDYRSPPPSSQRGVEFAVAGGAVLGVGIIALGSFFTRGMAVEQLMRSGNFPTWGWVCIGAFAVIAAASFFARRRLSRASRPSRRSAFAAGLLMGVGVTALVEGACFTITSMS